MLLYNYIKPEQEEWSGEDFISTCIFNSLLIHSNKL